MNFIKRAILSSKARIGKTIILFAVMLTISIVALAGFGIKSATEKSSVLARQKLGAEVSLRVNMEKIREEMMKNAQNGGERVKVTQTPIPLEYLDELKNSKYVSDYLISTATQVNSKDITAVGSVEEENSNTNKNSNGMESMPSRDHMGSMGDFTLNGVSNMLLSEDAKSGNIEILEGRAIETEDNESKVAVIEQALATENNLKVGDKITLYNTNNEENSLELEIVGIYKNNSEFGDEAFRNASRSPYNQIYVPFKVVNKFKGDTYNNAVDKIVFYLNDPINVERFLEEAKKSNIDFDKFTLDANNIAYETMMGPIENVASFSNTALILVTCFGAVILALIIMLSVKDRISEIGILLSLGESKLKIIGQFLAEILLVLVLALGTTSLAGGSVSNVISSKLLNNEIQVSETQSHKINQPGGPMMNMNKEAFKNNSKVYAIDELKIDITYEEFLKMSGLAVIVAIIATMIPAAFIMRLHPKTILSKHN